MAGSISFRFRFDAYQVGRVAASGGLFETLGMFKFNYVRGGNVTGTDLVGENWRRGSDARPFRVSRPQMRRPDDRPAFGAEPS